MPPEMRLLLMCSRPTDLDADKEAIDVLIRSAIDWDSFIALANRHHLPAIVYFNSGQLDSPVFPERSFSVYALIIRGTLDGLSGWPQG